MAYISIPDAPQYRAYFPDAATANGQLLIPHKHAETVILRKLGFTVTSPVTIKDYDWCGGTPFDIQRKTVEMLIDNPRAYVLSSMGTGKSKSALWAFDMLRREGAAKRMLIVAPLSTLRFTWAREVLNTIPYLRYQIVHGTKEKRLKLLAEEADVYIINHDGVRYIADELGRRRDIDVVCIDELATYRNKSQRTEVMVNLARQKPIVWGMTGSPTPNSPTDVFWQAKIITPNAVPKYFSHFREQMMLKVTQFKWVPKSDAVNRAMNCLQPNVRFTLDDVTELPEFVSRQQTVGMGAKQAKIYEDIRKAAFAMAEQKQVTAANAGAVMSKLLQISLGWVYSSEHGKEPVRLDGDARVEAMLDTIRAAERKVIVFVPFKHALAGLAEEVNRAGYSCETVSGDTSATQRAEIFHKFQNTDACDVLLAHPQCVAHGITLTAANTIIWYGPITSLEIYEQANARIRRVGQKHKQLFLHLQGTAVEKKIYNLLIHKMTVQDALLSMLEDDSWVSMDDN